MFLASFHMEGMAIVQFQEMEETYNDQMEALINLKQNTSMKGYKTHFELLSNEVRGLSDAYCLSCFLKGIMLGVRIFNPSDLVAAYSLVKMWEENLKMVQGSCRLNVMAIIGKNFPINQSKGFTGKNLSIQLLTLT